MRSAVLLGLIVAFSTGFATAAEPPRAAISNGQIRAKIYLPDAKKGFYRGTRFDWSGVISSLEYKGHSYFGPWFTKVRDDVHDFVYEGSDIVVGAASGTMGPAEEFAPLGFDEAPVGGTFIKIGIGVLRKEPSGPYDRFAKYTVVDAGKWSVRKHADSVDFTQVLNGGNGISYVYTKTVKLVKGKPEMVLSHKLKNTGTKAISTNSYDHNFLTLDGKAAGPGYSVTFPFTIQASNPETGKLAAIEGKQLVYKESLSGKDRVMTEVGGFSDKASDYDLRFESTAAGAGMRVTGDRPLSRAMLWSIRSVVSVEPFIDISVKPGEELAWNITYDFYTLGK